jgi:glyoxylase-like metal-dependent hydrolase (beta-lactamase superfamily II)
MTLIRLHEHVWMFPADPNPLSVQPNIGVIRTQRGTVLIDGGNSPLHGQHVLHALADIDALPVIYIIYTHFHWDHVYGAQVFDAPAIAHEMTREVLVERAARPWSAAFVEEEMRKNPALATMYQLMNKLMRDQWQHFRIVVPRLTFSGQLRLYPDEEVVIECFHLGGGHAHDSIGVRVRDTGVVFVGDSFYRPVPPVRDATYDQQMIADLLADDRHHTFVDGHTPHAMDREEFGTRFAGR